MIDEPKLNTDFDLYQAAPPQVKALKITEDLLTVLAARIRNRAAYKGWFEATELGNLMIEPSIIGGGLLLYGTKGLERLYAGDWIVIHPDGRHYTMTNRRFQTEYARVEKPRVVSIPVEDKEGL